MPSHTLVVGVSLVLLWFLKQIYEWYSSPLSAIPNAHFSVPFSQLWNLSNKWRARENRARLKAHQKLGPIVRIGPQELSIDSMDFVQQIYGGNYDKDAWYQRAFTPDEPPVMFTTLLKGPHAERKRMLARHYSKLSIQKSSELQAMCRLIICGDFREKLHEWAREDTIVDIVDIGRAMVMDLTTAWLFGPAQRTHLLQDHVAAETILDHFKFSFVGHFWRSEFWDYLKHLQRVGIWIAPRTAHASRLALREWGAGTVEASHATHKSNFSDRNETDYNSSDQPISLKLRQALKDSGVPDAELSDIASGELLDHLLASHDVSGVVLTYLLYELSKHPAVGQALREEVRANFALDTESYSRCFENMPLLDAVLMETLRLRSANPGPWLRRTPSPNCKIGAFDIPGNTLVSATSYTLHRNPIVFSEPEEWIPARWLDASKESHKEMMRWFWAFGSGARMCIGSHFAIQNQGLKVIVATIYSEFETQIVDDSGMEQIDGIVAGPVGDKLPLKFRHASTMAPPILEKEAFATSQLRIN